MHRIVNKANLPIDIEDVGTWYESSLWRRYCTSFCVRLECHWSRWLIRVFYLRIFRTVDPEAASNQYSFKFQPITRKKCSCDIDDRCVDQIHFYQYPNYAPVQINFTIPNFFVGCSAVDSVRQSSLECFFDSYCLQMLLAKIPEFVSEDYASLLIDTPVLHLEASRFASSTLLGVIIDELMVDEWNVTINYNNCLLYTSPSPRD